MNLRDLEYLVAVDELRHFRKAAERCHVSQPTLSGQLKKLEEYLGVQLIERTNRKTMITPAGKEIVRRARILLDEGQGIIEFAKRQGNPMSGPLRLGLIPTIAPYLLPRIMPVIHDRYPELELLLFEGQTSVSLEKLQEGQLEAAILALPVPGTDRFEGIHLYDEAFYLATADEHPLAERSAITIEDLRDQEVMLLEEGHCLRGHALDVCSGVGAREVGNFRATSLETLRQMVAAGSGITLIPEMAIERKEPSRSIRYLPFKAPAPTRAVGLLYRGTDSRVTTYRTLADTICEAVAT